MEYVLPSDYSAKDYENDKYAYTVCTRRDGVGDKEAAERALTKIKAYEKQRAERIKAREDFEEQQRKIKQELLDRAKKSMANGYGSREYENDKYTLNSENETEDTKAFVRMRMEIFDGLESRRKYREQKEKEEAEQKQRAAEAEEKARQEKAKLEKDKAARLAKIKSQNKRVDAYNKKQEEKNELYRKHIKRFLLTIDESDEFAAAKAELRSSKCKNPEFNRGFVAAVSDILDGYIGISEYLYPYKKNIPMP